MTYPKAEASLRRDEAELLTFFDFPAGHWVHLRTANEIESPIATVRLRQRVTKGAGSRAKGLLMAFKLLEMAQKRWRRINGAHGIPLVRAEGRFIDGARAERRNAARSSYRPSSIGLEDAERSSEPDRPEASPRA